MLRHLSKINFAMYVLAMYNKSISKSRFSKVLPNFADELLMASLQISLYWLSGSDVIFFIFSLL